MDQEFYKASLFVCLKKERRWRHCSTGSDSSTGSSEASVWTTGVAQKFAKANVKNSSDIWPSSRRFGRAKNFEEGALLVGVRPSNNSESSDTTDTTVTTTTMTIPTKAGTMVTTVPTAKLSQYILRWKADAIIVREQRHDTRASLKLTPKTSDYYIYRTINWNCCRTIVHFSAKFSCDNNFFPKHIVHRENTE